MRSRYIPLLIIPTYYIPTHILYMYIHCHNWQMRKNFEFVWPYVSIIIPQAIRYPALRLTHTRTCLPLTCDILPFPFTHFALRCRSLSFLFIAQFTFTLNFRHLSWLSACAYALFQRLVIYCARLWNAWHIRIILWRYKYSESDTPQSAHNTASWFQLLCLEESMKKGVILY